VDVADEIDHILRGLPDAFKVPVQTINTTRALSDDDLTLSTIRNA
jgi:hypothetical protein